MTDRTLAVEPEVLPQEHVEQGLHGRLLLGSLGKDVTYWENIEGGHGGAADAEQQATMQALLYVFLRRHLGLDGAGAVGHTSE